MAQTEREFPRDAPQQEIDQRFYAIVTDLIGNPSELTAPDGTLASYQQRNLWGSTLWRGSAQTPLRFPGQYSDPETGLHYNCQRYYDPVSASYLNPDPLGLAPAPNPHAYVANPLVLMDPLGLKGAPGSGARFVADSGGAIVDADPDKLARSAWVSQELARTNALSRLPMAQAYIKSNALPLGVDDDSPFSDPSNVIDAANQMYQTAILPGLLSHATPALGMNANWGHPVVGVAPTGALSAPVMYTHWGDPVAGVAGMGALIAPSVRRRLWGLFTGGI
jgi:RHS repeat-associated protein